MNKSFQRSFGLSLVAVALIMVAVVTVGGEQPTLAQGPVQGRPSINAQAFNACTTTDYATIAAKALGITAVELRKGIVGGQTLQDIATGKNVSLQTVVDAIQTARKTDIDQAVKDGVLTQDEATAMEAPAGVPRTPPAQNGNNGNNGNQPGRQQGAGQQGAAFNAPFPDISTFNALLQPRTSGPATPPGNAPRGGGFGGFGGLGGFGFGNALFNRVKQYAVAAQPLNIKCADLVKTLITPPGKSIAALAADQKVDVQTVTDALTKAYKDALAQDVTEGIITQAQSDQLSALLDKTIATFINNPLPMGPQATPAR